MNPLGDDTGLLALFGACTAIVLLAALRLRARRRPIVASTVVGLLCGMVIYAAIAVLSLLAHGTGGYDLSWWLLLVGAGLVQAGVPARLCEFPRVIWFQLHLGPPSVPYPACIVRHACTDGRKRGALRRG